MSDFFALSDAWAARTAARDAAPKKKRGNPEREAQRAVKAWLETQFPGCIVAAVENERKAESKAPHSRARYAAERKKSGIVSGFPDLTVWLPGGRVVLIEMKSATGVLSDAQKALHPKLRALGFVVIVARDIETARLGFQQAGLLPWS
jgi:hypothetical protein